MIGEIVAIGDELTSGERLDTNSQWIAQQLGDIGVRVMYHSAVGDELPPMIEVLRVAAARANVVVCTGGLGPTADDLTRDAIAECAGVTLVKDDAVLTHIRKIYSKRQRPMPDRNIVQAMFPAGSDVIPNPHGSAPGIDMVLPGDCRIFALPGVPAEMKEMYLTTVAPMIIEMIPPQARRVIRHRRFKCFGVGESDLEAMLPDLIARTQYPRVGITVSKATITLRVTAIEVNEEACLVAMEPTIETIRAALGDLIFGEEDDELQHAVGRRLVASGQTLATAEQFTGGLLAGWLAAIPESEKIFLGGRLMTDKSFATEESVTNLAVELREQTGAHFALVVSACDKPASDDGRIHIALVSADRLSHRIARNIGHPDIRQSRIAKAALDMLRKQLT